MRLLLVTAATADPVSLAEAKRHARIEENEDTPTVAALIKTATALCERFTNRAFLSQSYKLFLDEWPAERYLEMPRAPLMSVTHVKTYDDADAATLFASSNYFVDVNSRPGRIVLRDGASWPALSRVANGVEIQFAAGYGSTPLDVPIEIRQAILLTLGHLYEHRGDAGAEMPETAFALLAPHRDWMI